MTRPMAAWRTTYTPGEWLALSGPNTLVVMTPPPARASATVNDLWLSVVGAGSLDALLKLVSEVGLDAMPDLGAFHWDDEGLHGIARGRVQVVDTDSAEVVLQGEGSVTWREEHLGRERNLGITLEEVQTDDVLQLPLVVGAATVSAIFLTTNPAALVHFPAAPGGEVAPADEPAAVDEPAAEDEPSFVAYVETPAEAEGNADEGSEELFADDEDSFAAYDAYDPGVSYEAFDEPGEATPEAGAAEFSEEMALEDAPPAEEFVEEQPQDHTLEAGPEEIAAALAGIPAGLPGVPSAPPVAPELAPVDEPLSMSSPGADRSDPIVIPPDLGEVEDDGGTIFSTGLAATHKPAPPAEERPDPQVLAVPCTNGHANAPGSRTCRICQYPVDSTNPRLIRRPTLAGVHTNRGDFADIVAGVIVGRAPDASKGPAGSYLMRVLSPGNDISRNHVLITTQDWNVHVTDLNSTNGTTVLPDGEPPFTLRDGASVQVGIGTVLDLGDGVSLRIEPPRG